MVALKSRTHAVRLTDDSVVQVDDKTAWGVKELLKLIDRLATGRTRSFALIEARQGAPIESLVFTQGGEKLGEIGDKLFDMSGRLHKLGSVWEGDAPSTNRSLLKH